MPRATSSASESPSRSESSPARKAKKLICAEFPGSVAFETDRWASVTPARASTEPTHCQGPVVSVPREKTSKIPPPRRSGSQPMSSSTVLDARRMPVKRMGDSSAAALSALRAIRAGAAARSVPFVPPGLPPATKKPASARTASAHRTEAGRSTRSRPFVCRRGKSFRDRQQKTASAAARTKHTHQHNILRKKRRNMAEVYQTARRESSPVRSGVYPSLSGLLKRHTTHDLRLGCVGGNTFIPLIRPRCGGRCFRRRS